MAVVLGTSSAPSSSPFNAHTPQVSVLLMLLMVILILTSAGD